MKNWVIVLLVLGLITLGMQNLRRRIGTNRRVSRFQGLLCISLVAIAGGLYLISCFKAYNINVIMSGRQVFIFPSEIFFGLLALATAVNGVMLSLSLFKVGAKKLGYLCAVLNGVVSLLGMQVWVFIIILFGGAL